MSLTLILMRHAKSDWDAGLDDFERPLNQRGRDAAPAIANWLVDHGHRPDVVLVSGARRTVETWERMASAMPETVTVQSVPALYHSGPATILSVLHRQSAPSLMLIAHNPGIAAFAYQIVDAPPDHPKFSQYPTAATTVIGFDKDDWRDVTWGTGTVLDFTVPRDLTE